MSEMKKMASGWVVMVDGTEFSSPLPLDKAADMLRRVRNGENYGNVAWDMLASAENRAIACEYANEADVITAFGPAKDRLKIEFESAPCTRCGGTGKYLFTEHYGRVCFLCGGQKRSLTRRGAAARKAYDALVVERLSGVERGPKRADIMEEIMREIDRRFSGAKLL